MSRRGGRARRAALLARVVGRDRLDPALPGPRGVLSRWVLTEAEALLERWAEVGWAPPVARQAEALADTILRAWGPGEYRIRTWVVWRERGVAPDVEVPWMRHPRR